MPIAKAKTATQDDRIAVLIPVAGPAGQKGCGSPALFILPNNEILLNHQISLIHNVIPTADIIVGVGFESEKVVKQLQHTVKVVENESWSVTNTTRTIRDMLRVCPHSRSCLIIHGDTIFDEQLLRKSLIDVSNVCGFVGNGPSVSITTDDGLVSRFAYGQSMLWSQTVFLKSRELELARELVEQKKLHGCFTFEILNKVMERGGRFKFTEIDNRSSIEIFTVKEGKFYDAQKVPVSIFRDSGAAD